MYSIPGRSYLVSIMVARDSVPGVTTFSIFFSTNAHKLTTLAKNPPLGFLATAYTFSNPGRIIYRYIR